MSMHVFATQMRPYHKSSCAYGWAYIICLSAGTSKQTETWRPEGRLRESSWKVLQVLLVPLEP